MHSDPPSPTETGGLSETERGILDFELTWKAGRGSKRDAVQNRFGWHLATYYRRRAALVERPEAAEYAPALVRRLRHGR